jgi:hypothetical protein
LKNCGRNRRRLHLFVTTATSLAAGLCIVPLPVSAQRSVEIASLVQAPVLDGNIGAQEWSAAAVIDETFVQIEPSFGDASPYRTVVRIGQTDAALYVAFEAFDPEPSRLAAAVRQRDGGLDTDDSVSVAFDTFSDERTAYLFRTNALATQEDGRIADNGRTVDQRWDAAWRSAAMRYEDRWIAELEIPFSILRYAGDSDGDWRVNFVRTIPRRLETSLWSGPGETVWRVSSFGELKGVSYPVDDSEKWVLIPYGLAVFGPTTALFDFKGASLADRTSVCWPRTAVSQVTMLARSASIRRSSLLRHWA